MSLLGRTDSGGSRAVPQRVRSLGGCAV